MKKRIFTLALAIIMVFQTMVPVTSFAKETTPEQNNLVKVGAIDVKSYPQLDAKTVQEANRRKKQELQGRKMEKGAQLFSSPYFPKPGPDDNQKPLIFANVNAIFTTKGLDGGKFDWEGVFGKDSDGKLNKAQIVFEQMDDKTSTRTGVKFFLKVDKAGTYTWSDSEGKPTKLPLYSTDLKPYRYEVLLDEDVTEHVKLLTARFIGTEGGYAFGKPDPDTGEIVGNIKLDLSLQQIASTKFISKWNTGVGETDRPTVEGSYLTGYEADPEDYGIFKFPSNDTDKTIIRNDALDPQNPGEYSEYIASQLDKTPKVGVADPDPDATDTYTLDRANKKISYKGKTYKYEVEYDVINGGKLTMTEVIPVTFNANGGKFKNFTDPDTETKIVKEVDYNGTLTDKAEDPKKDRETFKGWATEAKGTPLSEAEFNDAIKNIKEAKTFYAIWDNNDITADQLEVKESFKDGTGYVNDFIPKLADLKKQVKIKDAAGKPQALKADDKFEVLKADGKTPFTDQEVKDEALKAYLYDKLSEKTNPKDEPTRKEIITAKVTHANGTSQTVDIPIKVYKNIYEAKTLTKKPYYVPADYVMVTVDPTDKAKDPQKTYYYVNKDAKVVIPGETPKGKGDNKFVKWTLKADDAAADVKGTDYKLADKPRTKFENASTITAQYVTDVIPQEGDTKPDYVPTNFVSVTFEPTKNGTLDGAKVFWVNPEKEVTIPVKDAAGKEGFTFKGWKIGDDSYKPIEKKKFTDNTTVTASYDQAGLIIPYDPSSPLTKPEGYIRVTYQAEEGLTLSNVKFYYVKKNAKDANGKSLTLADLKKPSYTAETGYTFEKWYPEKDAIGDLDITVKARAKKLDPVIPATDSNGNPNKKPAGYKEVTFVIKTGDEAKGSIQGVAKFYVNPKEYVKFDPPETEANTGFEFGAWDKDVRIPTVYTANTTVEASFNEAGNASANPTPGKKEVKVIFRVQGEGGGPALNSTNTYYVTPGKEVSLNPPKVIVETGYEFQGWDPDATVKTSYNADTIVTGTFKPLPAIVDGSQAKPDGYVRVEFRKGEHGMLEGQTVYYVNPKAKKTFGDLTKPKVKPDPGYQHEGWSHRDQNEIKSNSILTANYREIPPVVPQFNDQGQANTKPKGYITVTFSTETNGKVKGTTDTKTKVVYINPNKAVVLDSFAPEITPKTGYEFASWSRPIKERIQYEDKDVIKAQYNELGNVLKAKKPGYIEVQFKPGDYGTLSGDTNLWIKPGAQVVIPAPDVDPNVGYKFDKWDKDLTVTLAADAETYVITAKYAERGNIIPQENTDGSDKPKGYHTVTFKSDVNGTISGTTVYYVKPGVNLDLTTTANGITKNANVGFTADGGTWNPAIASKQFTANETYTFKFKALADVIEKTNDPNQEKPNGYLTVKVVPTNNATDKTEKTYYVNPNKEVTIPFAKPVGKDVKVGEDNNNKQAYKWIFKNWTSDEVPTRVWDKNLDDGFTAKFTKETTTITANYDKSITDQGSVTADQVTVHESYKDGNTWVNNFIDEASETKLKAALKVKGNPLPNDATVTFLDDADKAYANEDALKTALYDKLQEKANVNNEPTRIEKVKAQVKFKNGEVQNVEIPIKVIKNIYEATTNEGKPSYVPGDYVKVTLDPTAKAEKPQKYFYYVNPAAKVVIPGTDPTGIGDNKFIKWAIGDTDYKLAERHQFSGETTITAQYSGDIVPQTGTKKPDGVPKNFVSVEFKQGTNGTLAGTTKYWVNPKAGKKLSDIAHPSVTANQGWKHTGWDKTEETEIKSEVEVTAQYLEKVLTANPNDTENYVKVNFNQGDHGTIADTATKTYWVLKDEAVTLTPPTVTSNEGYAQKSGDDAWSPKQMTKYSANTEHVAQYDYNGENVIPQPGNEKPGNVPDNFVLVEFKPGSQGTIASTETVKYWVNPTALVTLPAPKVTPNAGYEQQKGFNAWDHYLRDIFNKETVITAQYEKDRGGDWQTGTLGSTRILTVVEKEVVKVPAEKTFRKEVRYMQGFNNYFRPTEGLTRAEAAQILANALVEDGYRYDPNFTIRYKDIVGNEWYAKAIRITSQANVFKGYDTGYFDPHKKITRAEWIGTLRRFQELERAPGNHMQVRPDHWAMGEIEAAYKEGWLAIYGQGLARFNADEFIPRQEVAAVSNKAFNRVLDKTYIHRNSKNLINYKDVNPSMWSYEDILCASNGYLHDGKSFWGHKIDYKKDLYNINLDGYTVTKDKFQRLERR